jgi:GNAT superfamily N-acetyltransferase
MGRSEVQFSRLYGFVRSRQLDGTFPGDAGTGVWPITACRIERGWGMVPENDWPYPARDDPWPPVEPPGLDAKARNYRIVRYQRITNSYEAKIAISRDWPVGASFEITKQWYEAENGVIETPPEGAQIIGSHQVLLVGYSDEKQAFRFRNSWGTGWGNQGYGHLSYEFFERWLVEAWITEGIGERFATERSGNTGFLEIDWAMPDFAGRIFHGRDIYDGNLDERVGWAFAVQKERSLDIEELFVRPQYRRQRHGTRLLRMLRKLSADTGLALRFIVPFADCDAENLSRVERLLSKESYFLVESGVRWCPLVALRAIDRRTWSSTPPSMPALRSPRYRSAIDEFLLSSAIVSDAKMTSRPHL